MELIFATHNIDKLDEVKAIFTNTKIITLKDLEDFDDVNETGSTFKENAYLKAKYYYDKYKKPVFADDSGLVIEALHGEPGIFSSRYSKEATYYANNIKVLEKLGNSKNRKAYFITLICFIDKLGIDHYFEGRVYGEIINELNPDLSGFGYDPIFYLPEFNKTFKELGSKKNTISHRYNALKEFEKFLNEENNNGK